MCCHMNCVSSQGWSRSQLRFLFVTSSSTVYLFMKLKSRILQSAPIVQMQTDMVIPFTFSPCRLTFFFLQLRSYVCGAYAPPLMICDCLVFRIVCHPLTPIDGSHCHPLIDWIVCHSVSPSVTQSRCHPLIVCLPLIVDLQGVGWQGGVQ